MSFHFTAHFFQNLLTAGCVVAVVIVVVVVLCAWRGPMRAILNLGALEKHAGPGVVLLKKYDASFISLETSFRWWSQSIGIFTKLCRGFGVQRGWSFCLMLTNSISLLVEDLQGISALQDVLPSFALLSGDPSLLLALSRFIHSFILSRSLDQVWTKCPTWGWWGRGQKTMIMEIRALSLKHPSWSGRWQATDHPFA